MVKLYFATAPFLVLPGFLITSLPPWNRINVGSCWDVAEVSMKYLNNIRNIVSTARVSELHMKYLKLNLCLFCAIKSSWLKLHVHQMKKHWLDLVYCTLGSSYNLCHNLVLTSIPHHAKMTSLEFHMLPVSIVRLCKEGPRVRARGWATLGVYPMSWLLKLSTNDYKRCTLYNLYHVPCKPSFIFGVNSNSLMNIYNVKLVL